MRVFLLAATVVAFVSAGSVAWSQAPRQVNITSDSAPGWTPSVEQEEAVRRTVGSYLLAKDTGHYGDAYEFLTDPLKADQTLKTYAEESSSFNHEAGGVARREITTITWTKDPPQAPLPGVYAAVDLTSRFANIQRHCGYVVLFQPDPKTAFGVMREESNYLTDKQAAQIAREKSQSEVDALWQQLSANCPNYRAEPAPLAEAKGPVTSYPSVAKALDSLRARTDVTITEQDGWSVAEEKDKLVIWSFAPTTDPAYPAVARREVVERAGAVSIEMAVQCEASKAACDDFVRRFQTLNKQMSEHMRSRAASRR